ncbi:hypothetical protein [Streptacidiphilus jiangxiensis]|uniref:Uncharacterized protein n=1 Tax=Streptacidiphilus jiangxiensis TaxID=235985 RepID=A0A1H8B2L2_STRJI|nr:hypothetical protein [Streptacidiphilus jiangxiensis]SEM76529.1 hypothetical protein SAMN05414137_1553 [Streptacidiphilus jiangxiensis]
METGSPRDATLLDKGLDVLRGLLGPTWELEVQPTPEGAQDDSGADVVVQLKTSGDSTFAQLLVDAKTSLTPRAVREQLAPKAALMRKLQSFSQPLVITEALTERTKAELREHNIAYLDLLGNVSLRIPRPAVVILADSPQRAPRAAAATAPARPKLAGPRAGQLVRLLADVAPPYQAADLTAAVPGITRGYVSKVLDAMEDLLLIRREGRAVVDVDWKGLLRTRAEQLNLLHHNPHVGMIAPNGPGPLLEAVRQLQREGEQIALTGSYAARQIAPLAVGGQVMLYVPPTHRGPYDLGERLGLLPADQGADVLLLRAHDDIVFARTRSADGLRQVALSQLVLDCLSGPGRMPAEGEAVLSYMADNEHEWRIPAIAALPGGARP